VIFLIYLILSCFKRDKSRREERQKDINATRHVIGAAAILGLVGDLSAKTGLN
jgi:hypothetical protein